MTKLKEIADKLNTFINEKNPDINAFKEGEPILSEYDPSAPKWHTAEEVVNASQSYKFIQWLINHFGEDADVNTIDDGSNAFKRAEKMESYREIAAWIHKTAFSAPLPLSSLANIEQTIAKEAQCMFGELLGTNIPKQTPLLLAVTNGRLDIVEILLAHGANPRTCNSVGHTPLLLAVANNRDDIAEVINTAIAKQANTDDNRSQTTPVKSTACMGSVGHFSAAGPSNSSSLAVDFAIKPPTA